MRCVKVWLIMLAFAVFSAVNAEEPEVPETPEVPEEPQEVKKAKEPQEVKAADLAELLHNSKDLFTLRGNAISKRFPQLLWRSREKKTLYCPGAMLKNFCYSGEKIYDLQINVENQQISAFEVTIYTRGDAGKLSRSEVKEKLRQYSAALAAMTGGTRNRSFGKLGNIRLQTERYTGKNLIADLEFVSGKNDAAERITLKFMPVGVSGEKFRDSIKTSVASSSLSRKVIRKNGEHYILLPMVDQGEKGYCVPATVSRVLIYYGSDMDMHSVARLLNADPKSGTNVQRTVNTLRDMVSKLRVRFAERYQFELMRDARDYASFARRYNRIAKKMKVDTIPGRRPKEMPQMTYAVFKEIRNNRPIRDFRKYVKSCIDRGVPICWSIMVFPTDKAAGGDGKKIGGHMRLITGYCDNGNIIYSDSWGKGHEKKVIRTDDAIAITKRLFTLEPRR